MSCELTQSVLHGYIDGELDAARAADFERHLLSCSQCTSALESQETLRSSIQRAGLYERAPATLRRKVEAAIPHTCARCDRAHSSAECVRRIGWLWRRP